MKSKKNSRIIIIAISLSVLIIGASMFIINSVNKAGNVTFEHIHGLGFTGDGEKLLVPAHDGLRIYENDAWEKSKNEPHDYMGFSMTSDGFYSSGHPSPSSDLKNPFGIIKSDDTGSKIEPLALYGEVDFHGMSAGYHSSSIYVINSEPNSIMSNPGLFYSLDNTENWKQSKVENLTGQATTLAVHPDNENMVAMGTNEGVFISLNNGDNFEQALEGESVSALSYTFDEQVMAASMKDKVKLSLINLDSLSVVDIKVPKMESDEYISYLAANPSDVNTFSFTTSENNIYLTQDLGESWNLIVEKGKAVKGE
ncbi:F510_1955 family glycosylhydrolase [Metabacillus herbersteinensis]|uniref:F510_1955 family glycosylhydrolase n=1 Tax=Metabacillus herbersteinensis TaxID=283816 RepID=A0ABV6GMB2_9BACI